MNLSLFSGKKNGNLKFSFTENYCGNLKHLMRKVQSTISHKSWDLLYKEFTKFQNLNQFYENKYQLRILKFA